VDCLNVRIQELEHDREKFLGEVREQGGEEEGVSRLVFIFWKL
jgi:hypothetical protein